MMKVIFEINYYDAKDFFNGKEVGLYPLGQGGSRRIRIECDQSEIHIDKDEFDHPTITKELLR
ncbi:MAG: hypothetical protein WCT49_04760 [Candidatus Paceibacterota bacterium]|jgi:hypothetical protein